MATFAELSDKLPTHEREHVRELAENVLFMRRKLEETRLELENQPIVIPYNNGGGQSGIRANPAYAEYEKLLKSYTSALKTLREIIGKAGDRADRSNIVSIAGNSKWANRAVNG